MAEVKKSRACRTCGNEWALVELRQFDPPRVLCSGCVAKLVVEREEEKPVDDDAWQTELDGVPVWMAFVAMGVGVVVGVALVLAIKGF